METLTLFLTYALEVGEIVFMKNHGIARNFVNICGTEFQEIPWNFRQFRTEYGRDGSTKNVWNSAFTEFYGHPNSDMEGPFPKLKVR